MVGLIVDDVLFSMKSQLWRVQINMDRAQRNEKKADNFKLQAGCATFVGIRYTLTVLT